jgi:predicted MFS family arabinose efflux permease
MSTVFLVRLPEIGQGKAGWYKGTLTLGIQFLGPLTGNYAIAQLGLNAGFLVSAAMFALLAVVGWNVLPSTTGHQQNAATEASSWRELLRLPAVRVTYVFEVLASFTASSVGVFSILLALRVLHWPKEHAVWLMAVQGLSFVLVLFGLGRWVVKSPRRDQLYGLAHLAVIASLLTLGLWPTSVAYLVASVLLGFGLGVNNLVNMDRISRAPVDKAKVSSHLTLMGMAGGTLGALTVGQLSDRLGLQPVFLTLTLPWIAAWLLYHGRALSVRLRGASRSPAAASLASPVSD